MEPSRIANAALAPEGRRKLAWARQFMPVLNLLEERYREEQPLAGSRIATCLHLEAKTACLLRTLARLGAEVTAAGSNPLSTQDDVCAALAEEGVTVYSRRGMTSREYSENIRFALGVRPTVVIDDGCDLVAMLHDEMRELLPAVRGGSEETTTGVKRLAAMEADGVLEFPMIAVNDAHSKFLFDNRYGTGQSVWDGIMRTTNLLVAGKAVVVAGYGWCGRGVAMRADGLGARVIVVETDPHRALEALMDGYEVMDMAAASSEGDIFVTLTGNTGAIRGEHIDRMKDNALLANAGHFDVEISKPDLEARSGEVLELRDNVTSYRLKDGRTLHLLAEGRLVNLGAGDGHPVEIMDLSFALQLLSALHVHNRDLETRLYAVPEELDREVAALKLEAMGIDLEEMTEKQLTYMKSWRE
ncbi:MAG: adenosylhomocysteinase [Synergistales bacterium]|nr:adenosylhomocysteinase [Synergistales bacterium]